MAQNDNEKQKPLSWTSPQGSKTPAPAAPDTAAPSEDVSNAGKLVGWVVAGIVVGVVVIWGISALLSRTPNTETPGTAATSTTSGNTSAGSIQPGAGSDPSLNVHSPQKAGNSVAIAKAIVSEPTWVVVYESRDGKPGNILGASLFFPDRQAGSVELLRATVSGQSYFVTKHRDNGDHRFSKSTDVLLTEDGEPMWVTLNAN